ncbi:free fatty acid receptor 4-like [Argonauta hians]
MSALYTSYLYGVDTKYGWGNRSYFTFFSEFNRPWEGLGAIEALIYIIIFLVSLVANVLIITRVFQVKQLKTATNCFLANLAMADLLFSCGCPFLAVIRISGSWVLGRFVCHMIVYLLFVCMFAVIWTMTLISIERFLCIVKPNCFRITLKMALVIIAFIWLFAFTGFLPMAVFFHVYSLSLGDETVQICTLVWPSSGTVQYSLVFVACLVVAGFIIPLSLMIHNYYRVFRTFSTSRKTIKKKETTPSQPGMSSVSVSSCTTSLRIPNNKKFPPKKSRSMRSLRVIRILVLLVLLFFLMWLPIFIAFVVIQYDGAFEIHEMHSWILIASSFFAFGNTCVNPFVYVFINERFRLSFNCCKRKDNGGKTKTEEIVSFSLSGDV